MLESINTQIYIQLLLFFGSIVIGVLLTRAALMPAAGKVIKRRDGDIKAVHSFENIIGVAGLFVTFTVALQVANFGNLLTVLGTIAAAATVAVGFGMRDQISSLVAGIFIHTDNPYVKGDYIKVDEFEGVVRDVRLRATVIETDKDPKQVVPNNLVTTKTLKNFTRGRKTRRNIEISSEPGNAEETLEILRQAVEGVDAVWQKPAPSSSFEGMEDGKMKLRCSYWIGSPENADEVKDEIMRNFNSKMIEKGLYEEEEEE